MSEGGYLRRVVSSLGGDLTHGASVDKEPARDPQSDIGARVRENRAHWHSLALRMRGEANHRTPMSLSSFSRAISRTVVAKCSKAATSETSVILERGVRVRSVLATRA